MDKKFAKHGHYASRQTAQQDKTLAHHREFRIKHYAGDVVYAVDGFLDKNRDPISQDFKRLLFNSKDALIRDMWPEGAAHRTVVMKRPPTTATVFKNSMLALILKLRTKEPHYIHCIKPNEIKSPVQFDEVRVKHQIHYLNVTENVRVKRAGFAYRMEYKRFLQRYKFICRKTWPNFPGSDAEGVKCLLDEHRLTKDAEFGKTKVFIWSPESVYYLEDVRNKKLPEPIIFLQRIWRGTLARRRMLAVCSIIRAYRNHKLRSYLEKLQIMFEGVERRPDLGKSIRWPGPPKTFGQFVDHTKVIFNRWRASNILKRVPRDDWDQVRTKIAAYDYLHGRRKHCHFNRRWQGNYLATLQENPEFPAFVQSLNGLRSHDGFKMAIFSALIIKVNRHLKSADRAILITEKSIYKLDDKRFKSMKAALPLDQVTGLSVSDGNDQLVVIHFNNKSDFAFCIRTSTGENRVAELVGILVNQVKQAYRRDLKVTVASNDIYCMFGQKSCRIVIHPTVNSLLTPIFRKNGSDCLTFQTPA